MFIFEVSAGNFGLSFKAKFLKPLVLIDLFIINMKMEFVQRNHLQKKSYKQFSSKNKSGAARIFFVFNLFLNFNLFSHILSQITKFKISDQNRNMHIFYKKKIPKLNYIHQILFFGGLVQIL